MAKYPEKNRIRVHSESEYRIEVNDSGDEIVFDLRDTSLHSKVAKMIDTVNELTTRLEKEEKKIRERKDKPCVSLDDETTVMTQNQYDMMELVNQFYIEQRAALDAFMGEGSCQKIFGDKNYHGMIDDLMKALTPEFDKMGISTNSIMAATAQKYIPNREQRRAMTKGKGKK